MKRKKILKLGFIDTTYEEEGEVFIEYSLKTGGFIIEISDDNTVEMRIGACVLFK